MASAKTERKIYNNIPKESSLFVKPLAQGEIAKYRLLGVYNPLTKKKKLRTQILSEEETVVDDNGDLYDIAVIQSQNAAGDITFFPIIFNDDVDSTVELAGGSVMDGKVYKRMEISNFNKSNPKRDETITPLFERISTESDAEQEMKNRKLVRQALEIVDHMSEQDITEFLTAARRPLNKKEANRNALERIAETQPQSIIKANISSGSTELKEEIARLKKEGVILWNKETKKWNAFDDSTILTIKKAFGFDPINELYQHFSSNPEALSKVKMAYNELVKGLEQEKAPAPPAPKAPKK